MWKFKEACQEAIRYAVLLTDQKLLKLMQDFEFISTISVRRISSASWG